MQPCNTQNTPMSQRPEVLQACRENWVTFAEAERESLKQYCVICTQWCSPDRGGFKSHLRRAHPDLWASHSDLLADTKHHHRLKYRGPCKACKFVPSGAQKGAFHTHTCTAYYQACLLHRLSKRPELITDRSHHSDASTDSQGVVRTGVALARGADGDRSTPTAPDGRPPPEVAEAGRQRQGTPTGQARSRRQPDLVLEGRPRLSESGQRLPPLHGDKAGSGHSLGPIPAVHQPLLCDSTEVAVNQGGHADETGPVPTLHPAACLHDRVPRTTQPRPRAEQQGDLA